MVLLQLEAGLYQENLLNDAYARVIAGGLALGGENLKGDIEVAYGQNQASGGLAASLHLDYSQSNLSANTSYRFFATGYRSAVIDDARSSGHDLKVKVAYALTPNLVLSSDTQWRHYAEDDTSQFQSSFLVSYKVGSSLNLGERLFARDPVLQFGVQYDRPRSGEAGFRMVAGVSANDVFGISGSQVSITHRQGLGSTSFTDFSVAYRILENLSLRLTDRVVWGNSNSLLVGLESSFENCDVLSVVMGCETLDLGQTKAHAQYELTGGVSGQAGRVVLGIDTEIPLSDELTLNAGASQRLDFSDSQENQTALSAGAVYEKPEVLRAEVAYDLRFAVDVKHVIFASTTFALNDSTYGNVSLDYLSDPAQTPTSGLKFAVAAAHRGDAFNLLSSHALRTGQYAENETTELGGDTRVSFAIDLTWSLRAGYLYDYQETLGYRDLISLGASASLWSGGTLTGYGRIYHDWDDQLWGTGATLEASQALGCGVYGVVGYNLLDGVSQNDGATFGESGVFLRLDIVFDEQWTCGEGLISGRAFIDQNANGLRDEAEVGLSGLKIRLLDASGNLLKTTYSGETGAYSFKLRPGQYILQIELPQHYSFSPIYAGDPNVDSDINVSGQSDLLDVGWNQQVKAIDIGIVQVDGGRP